MAVTLEPCTMCAGAIVNARLDRVVWGADDAKSGACGSLYKIHDDPRLNHRLEGIGGVLRDESVALLQQFFSVRRGR
jgi:tRNA(adenine34) deaminase